MKNNKIVKNIITVAISNSTSIISGVIVGFCIPKILSVQDYGLYKTFTLYTTYLGFFSLGIIDGIVLDYGNFDYEKINKRKFRSFFKWYCLVHLLGLCCLTLLSIFSADKEMRFILFALGIDMVCVNITGYFQQISQFTRRFKEFSSRKIIQSLSNIITVVILWGLSYRGNAIGYQSYVTAVVLINIILTLWYVVSYQDIVFGESVALLGTANELIHLVKIGFPLLFANLCATLILALDRQFISVLFDKSTYAIYAFAYNMLSLVTTATSAIAVVLYPYLKRATKQEMLAHYPRLLAIMLVGVFFSNAIYFPLDRFVRWFLPKYVSSLAIFRIIFPGLAISSSITVIMHNYYKALGDNFLYFLKSIIVLIISAITNWIAYKCFGTTASISIASIITMFFWYIIVDIHFEKKYQINNRKNFFYLLLMVTSFYIFSGVGSLWLGFLGYAFLFTSVTAAFFYKDLCHIIQIRRNKC